MPSSHNRTAGYDPVAKEYAGQFFNELEHKPFDRELLDHFAELVHGLGPICDLGCGPGQIARYLHDQGGDSMGMDLSAEMVKEAQRLSPAIRFEQGDLRNLPADSYSWGGIAAFYSVIHIPPGRILQVMAEFNRVLKPNGRALIAFHIGDELIHTDEWYDKQVSLDFYFFQAEFLERALKQAGFEIEDSLSREPYEVEHPSQRGYILAKKP